MTDRARRHFERIGAERKYNKAHWLRFLQRVNAFREKKGLQKIEGVHDGNNEIREGWQAGKILAITNMMLCERADAFLSRNSKFGLGNRYAIKVQRHKQYGFQRLVIRKLPNA